MRILHLINNLDWAGGVETYVLNLLPELDQRGYGQAVVFRHATGSVMPPCGTIQLGTVPLSVTLGEVDQFGPSVVHVHNIYDRVLLDRLLQRYPVIFTTHGYQLICPAQDFYLERPREICNSVCGLGCFPSTLVKRCMPLRPRSLVSSYAFARWSIANRHRISHLVCPCHYASVRHRQAGFAADRISVIPYFCELAPLEEPRPFPEEPMISFVGRVTKYKGADLFVEILSKLPQHVRGQMVGNMNSRNRAWLEGMARERRVADRLILREWVDRVRIRSVFEETSVFVFPSIWPETLGIVGLEALATGVPVVAFEVGGVPEWLVPGKTGLVARTKDAADAARAIRELLDKPSLQKEMGRNGLKQIADRFSMDLHVTRLLEVYRGAATRGLL